MNSISANAFSAPATFAAPAVVSKLSYTAGDFDARNRMRPASSLPVLHSSNAWCRLPLFTSK